MTSTSGERADLPGGRGGPPAASCRSALAALPDPDRADQPRHRRPDRRGVRRRRRATSTTPPSPPPRSRSADYAEETQETLVDGLDDADLRRVDPRGRRAAGAGGRGGGRARPRTRSPSAARICSPPGRRRTPWRSTRASASPSSTASSSRSRPASRLAVSDTAKAGQAAEPDPAVTPSCRPPSAAADGPRVAVTDRATGALLLEFLEVMRRLRAECAWKGEPDPPVAGPLPARGDPRDARGDRVRRRGPPARGARRPAAPGLLPRGDRGGGGRLHPRRRRRRHRGQAAPPQPARVRRRRRPATRPRVNEVWESIKAAEKQRTSPDRRAARRRCPRCSTPTRCSTGWPARVARWPPTPDGDLGGPAPRPRRTGRADGRGPRAGAAHRRTPTGPRRSRPRRRPDREQPSGHDVDDSPGTVREAGAPGADGRGRMAGVGAIPAGRYADRVGAPVPLALSGAPPWHPSKLSAPARSSTRAATPPSRSRSPSTTAPSAARPCPAAPPPAPSRPSSCATAASATAARAS